jgi:hypothetical protein
LYVTEVLRGVLGESIVALIKVNRSFIGKGDLLIHQVVDVGLELSLVLKGRDFSCKVNLAENVF